MRRLVQIALAVASLVLLTGPRLPDDTLRNTRIARERMLTVWRAANNYVNVYGDYPSAPHVLFPEYISDPLVFYHPGDPDPPPETIDNSVPNAPDSAQVSFSMIWPSEFNLRLDTIVIQDNSPANNAGAFINRLAADGLIETVPPLATPDPPIEYIAQQNMRRLAFALREYASDNGEYYPRDLKQLWDEGYLDSPRTFWHPGDTDAPPTDITNNMPNAINSARISFAYFYPFRNPDPWAVLVQDNDPANNGGRFTNRVSLNTTEVAPPLSARTPTAFQTGQMNLRRVALGLQAYAFDNDFWLPASIEEVWTNQYVDDPFYFWNPGDADPRPTDITNAKPDAANSAAISFVYEFEGDQPVPLADATFVVQDNSVANSRGLGVSRVGLPGGSPVSTPWANWYPDCPGDVDGDDRVHLSDLAILLGNYGVWYVANPWDGDIDGDSHVTERDLQTLLEHFGEVCGPEPGLPIDGSTAAR